ncbi:MAG: TlpA family protein disulfide reductase [Bryobacterales bacterium]|nr:TlpA family protein disulfide reductase [Bryobacterales bacterium]
MRTLRWAGVMACLMLLCGTASLNAAGKLSNRRAPGFSLPDLKGQQYDGADFRGKVLLVEFMQTGCPFCKTMSGILEQTKAKYGTRIQILSVVVMPDTPDNVQKYIKEQNITTPILFDCGQMTASYLKITQQNPIVKFPHLFLVDKDGTIRNDFDHDDINRGLVTAKALAAEIDKLLADAPQGGSQKKR